MKQYLFGRDTTHHFALIKPGPIVSEISGSMGGTVFSHNRGGAYIRARVTPVNPNTVPQQRVRSRLNSIAKQWAQLNFGIQQAWRQFALNHPITNALGDPKILSGIAMYTKVNLVLLNIGEARLDTPPPNANVDALISVGQTLESVGQTITITASDPDPIPANTVLEIQMSRAVSLGLLFVGNITRFQATLAAGAVYPAIVPADPDGPALISGEIRVMQYRFISTQNGFMSEVVQNTRTVS